MSALAGVFDGLKTMGLLQLLLAFVACMAYVLAQGHLLGRVARRWVGAAALGSAAGFVALDRDWTNGVVLVAVAVAGIGSFTAIVWLTTRALGIDRPAAPDAAAGTGAGAQPAASSGETARPPIGGAAAST